jgi:hypothetical protein
MTTLEKKRLQMLNASRESRMAKADAVILPSSTVSFTKPSIWLSQSEHRERHQAIPSEDCAFPGSAIRAWSNQRIFSRTRRDRASHFGFGR